MINRNKLEHILEYAKQQRYIGQSCKVPPEIWSKSWNDCSALATLRQFRMVT
ncbi:Uncharacterised protein [Klebsiella pneumoniae]|uniref:Uncharacterized protein n=1 Tax=Klebsiella pneumoniae TaxID=573 RepID=A0A486V5A2_KLEPN|nr:hypothetical protein [Pseudomonas aeruginosa]CAA0261573.1 Uncharacterised protein [Klebsiella pneumoniae]CAA0335827.1 Uncharacterised protein [Klebsiella pneumoniae]CAF2465154.1 hypothetical protein AI2851V1_1666 [Klebsiella pneumoniae]CAF2520429.1 hypothetical protein AI2854V1_1665 [Klebsiella pneumoniae]